MSLTVVVPTHDEELHLRACLESVVGLAERIVVLDSHSTDATTDIAGEFAGRGVQLVQHAYEGPAAQKNWALDHLGIRTEWVLFLDADEIVTPELAEELRHLLDREDDPHVGYLLNRRIIWYGKWIRHGGWFPNWNLRLFRFGKARYEMRRVHEHMIADGPVGRLEGHLIHEDLRDLTHSIAKHNRYSSLEAAEYLAALEGERDAYARLLSRDPLARKRWIKQRVWSRLPAKALLYFVYAYVLRLGFLDGRAGLRYCALHAMYKHFDELKLWELSRYKDGAPEGGIRLEATYAESCGAARRPPPILRRSA